MTAFDDLGMKVEGPPAVGTKARAAWEAAGGGLCECGERVRFDLVRTRNEHLMVCPVVDRIITDAQAELNLDGTPASVDDLVAHFTSS